jgi:hypothetical protein
MVAPPEERRLIDLLFAINPVVMTPEEFRAKLKARDRFASCVAREPKLFIKGDASELGEPAQDRAA